MIWITQKIFKSKHQQSWLKKSLALKQAYFSLNSSRFKLKLFPKLKQFLVNSRFRKFERWNFGIFIKQNLVLFNGDLMYSAHIIRQLLDFFAKFKVSWLNSKIFLLNSRFFSLSSMFRKFKFQWLPENWWKNKPALKAIY